MLDLLLNMAEKEGRSRFYCALTQGKILIVSANESLYPVLASGPIETIKDFVDTGHILLNFRLLEATRFPPDPSINYQQVVTLDIVPRTINKNVTETNHTNQKAITENFQSQTDTKPNQSVKILFLASNPKNTPTLRIDEEIRAIDQVLLKAKFRDKFEIQQQWAVRVTDLQGHFLRYQPDIVHFSGHSSLSSEIILEDLSGSSQPVSIRALSGLFATLKDNIKCVVLNACYSVEQAEVIAQYVSCVVGMSSKISDRSAITFAASFYQAIGYGRSIQTAFDLATGQIDLDGLDEHDKPKLLTYSGNPEGIVFISN